MAETPTGERELAVVAAADAPEPVRDGIDDEDGDDALEEPSELVAADGSDTDGADETGSDANGEAGRRRRRRRGRRGRGRGRSGPPTVAGGQPDGEVAAAEVPALRPAEDEPFVPRGVLVNELMPAATGGRRRGRRGGRGRRSFGGGEPADPQLISPMNPVPKPSFDED